MVKERRNRPAIVNIAGLQYPTDEQAEVLVKNEIPVSDILQVCFKDDNDLAAGKAALSGYNTDNFVVDASLFINSRI